MAVDVDFLGHATVLIEIDGVRVLTDPLLFSRVSFLRRKGTAITVEDYADVDIVLISHLHHDHCDLRSLYQVRSATILTPMGSGAFLRARAMCRDVVEMHEGLTMAIKGLNITAVHADHDGSRVPFGPNAPALGYVITGESGTAYFAGDTDIFDDMSRLPMPESQGIDVAFLPVWGWGPNLGPGHMNPQRAAQSLKLLEPKIAVPIHWGSFYPTGLSRMMSSHDLLHRPPVDFAEDASHFAPDTEVIIMPPGSRAKDVQ